MEMTAGALARQVAGEVLGNPELLIAGAESIHRAGPTDITYAADRPHLRRLQDSSAGAAIVPRDEAPRLHAELPQLTLIAVADPQHAFIEILQQFRPTESRPAIGISSAAWISPTARIGENCNIFPGAHVGEQVEIGPGCDIHPGVVIGDGCRIGADCVLFPHVVLYPRVTVGNRVRIHAGAVLGADGFGYRFVDGAFEKIPQLGSVLIEDDVEIGACTTIDRGMIGPTIVGQGTKLDNLVMIGHNCELGRHNAYASQVGFAGSVTTGDYVRCAGQVGVAGHVHLGTGSVFGAKAGVYKDMPGGKTYLGIPVTEDQEQIRIALSQRKLPDLCKQVRKLEAQVAELTRQLQDAEHPTPRIVADADGSPAHQLPRKCG